jgi:drug/metabolite transporter (DMT)-like permease
MLSATIAPWWLWVVFTLAASTAQVFRNAAQRSLIDSLGTVGATHTRFIFGLPFGILFLLIVAAATGGLPQINLASVLWTGLGAVSQIAATALMLDAMRERSFVVTTAYTKTEPVQVAIFATLILSEHITLALAIAIIIATVGVIILSLPSRAGSDVFSWRPALLGIGAGALFAFAAVGFRGGITALGTAEFVPAATVTLAVSLAIQTVLLTAWLLWREPQVLRGIFRAWRVSLPAGALGAFASEMWFLAFAIQNPAKVRTLALVEIVIAGLVSRRLFAQTPTMREISSMALIAIGIVLLFNG